MRDVIEFVLGNFTLTFFVLGLIASAIALWHTQQPRSSAVIVEALFSYFLLFSIGAAQWGAATIIGGIPTSLAALLEVPTNGADLSSIRVCVSAGAVLQPAVGEAFRSRFGIQVHQLYGMTETASLISVVGAHELPIPGAAGHGPPGVKIEVRRVTSAPLRPMASFASPAERRT